MTTFIIISNLLLISSSVVFVYAQYKLTGKVLFYVMYYIAVLIIYNLMILAAAKLT